MKIFISDETEDCVCLCVYVCLRVCRHHLSADQQA